ncbi:hypothetical protein [Thermoflexus sp.]|uniref:hypothetical protein n=1 Tax=Thermoflexus sp. TaxID=1969742 RepID=UPI00175EE88D|nr:hypothetical protein [Thermoflexus sp.]
MAFTVRDLDDLIRLLDKHPQWLETLRQRLLTEVKFRLPADHVRAWASRAGLEGPVWTISTGCG